MKKKLLLLLIIPSLIISSLLLAGYAAAIEVCCEKLAGVNEYCVYSDEEKCDAKFKDAAINCEQTSFCKPGCCYSSDEGECYKNVARSECSSVEGTTWTESANCEIPQCQKGCCLLGSQGFFVTEVRCKLETSKYGNVTMQWKPEITSEPECQAQAKSQDLGCCVSTDKCSFTTRENCPSIPTAPTVGNQSREGFYKEMLCSNDLLSCGCAKQTDTGCYDDKVYWLDSCGNRENVYSSDKARSYNNGYVLDPDSVCNAPAVQDIGCGNCDYGLGSICRKAKNVKPKFGELICSTTKCLSTYNDGLSANAGTQKKNGESWCLYDSAVGKAQDPVGSRHYRHLCVNGEEMNEPCTDYREEICIQGVLGEGPSKTLEAFKVSGEYIEATCRNNRWEDCFECNDVKAGCGADCTTKECCVKKCCENEALRDCYYSSSKVSDKSKGAAEDYCVPQVPPGLQFWPSEASELPSSTTRSSAATTAAVTTGKQEGKHGGEKGPSSNAESVCSKGNQECTVVWRIGGTGKLGIGGLGTQKDYECVQNCYCTEPAWVIGGNTLCKSLGDCGAKFNILGKTTLDGYTNTASIEKKKEKGLYFDGYKLTEKDVGDWNTLTKRGEAIKKEGGFGGSMTEYLGRFGAPMLVFFASGLYSKTLGGEFLKGATGGLSILTNILSPSKMGIEAAKLYGKTAINEGAKITMGGTNYQYVKNTWYEVVEKPGELAGQPTSVSWTPINDATQIDKLVGEASKTGQATQASGNLIGAVNTIMWLYTIYNLIDILFADTKEKTYTISCSPWVAPEGGADCEKCNENKEKPCSLYRCKSLGQNCYLVNMGTSEEKCVNLNPNDVNSPIIEPWKDVITKGYTITPTTDEGNKGYKVNEKVGPYDTITLGIKTDEPAQCKFTSKVGADFDEMTTFFGDSQYIYEHQITFTIPAEFMTKEAIKKAGDTYNLYIRCKDASGNENEKDYFIRFSLKPEPDMTAPVIEQTSIESGAYISSDAKQTGFSVYVNEKAECKYDTIDKEFDLMSKKFTCQTYPLTVNSMIRGLYECRTDLELSNLTEYKWHIRCKDSSGNKNKESYTFNLLPTIPLTITSIGPTGTFYEQDVTLKATTADGAEQGKATCAYSNKDEPYNNMVIFFKTGEAYHEQPLNPGAGDFTYYAKCVDKAGNIASANTTFKIDVDLSAPKLLYIYVTPSNYLHIEMDESSTCEYSNSTFVYGAGMPMTGSGTTVHELSITEKIYYVTCQDVYANEAKFIVYP